ncbi:hypothetical protein [Bradyrhizobium sp. CB3481]|nr:hypothetical protein [Bradyrhizobium sp. CB3481]WFU18867.1 hypothetical protein QA643_11280 [Bradyrhizobium sp. CB3481]
MKQMHVFPPAGTIDRLKNRIATSGNKNRKPKPEENLLRLAACG